MNIKPGTSIGRYHVIEQLGSGGMAVVYKAYDVRLERDVALKIIRTDAFPVNTLERIQKRFDREAKALAKLSHPAIVKVYDYGEHDGAPYLVMEYHRGGTLKPMMGQAMPWQDAIKILLPIASALEYAHKQGIIHRDIKPSNILISDNQQSLLTDFGIAKILEETGESTLTGIGMGVGTPGYMAPEQWIGNAGPASDQYSLGVIMYELITGYRPFNADTPPAILLKQANDPLPEPRRFTPDLTEEIERILFKVLAKKAENRYATMRDFSSALEQALTNQSSRNSNKINEREKFETFSESITFDSLLIPEVSKNSENVSSQQQFSGSIESNNPDTPLILKNDPLGSIPAYQYTDQSIPSHIPLENIIQPNTRTTSNPNTSRFPNLNKSLLLLLFVLLIFVCICLAVGILITKVGN